MKTEKLAVIGLVAIIVIGLSAFILTTEDFGNLFGEQKEKEKESTIELGDCVDINYIGRYASNDTVFSSSYDDAESKTGGTPLKVYVNTNISIPPPTNYSSYISSPLTAQSFEEYLELSLSPIAVNEGFIEKLISLDAEDVYKKTIIELNPEKAFGITPSIGDILSFTAVSQIPLEYKILNIEKEANMPPAILAAYGAIFGEKTTLYTLRNNLYEIGDIMDEKYPTWDNSTVITKTNETMIWMYTTPPEPYASGANFTWTEVNSTTGIQHAYPQNSSSVTNINTAVITITNSPIINSVIEESIYYAQYDMYFPSQSYTVENLTDDKINVSYVDSETDEKLFDQFDRTITIQRNETLGITDDIPAEILEIQLFSLRKLDDNFIYGCGILSDEKVYFEFQIEKIYNTSEES